MLLLLLVNTLQGGTHNGFDLSTGQPSGATPLYSIITGTVTRKGYDSSGFGNYIEVQRSDGIRVLFGHMSSATTYNVGDSVLTGQQVGYEGTTGHSTGTHVHVQMWDANNNLMNSATFMGIPNEVSGPYIYDGTPIPPAPVTITRNKFKWVLYARKLRSKNIL